MVLCVSLLRRHVAEQWIGLQEWLNALSLGDAGTRSIGYAAERSWAQMRPRVRTADLLRARLALYLRAVLRADAGDCGPLTCSGCSTPVTATVGWCGYSQADLPATRRYVALWEQAGARKP
jgi:hypothetical protein